MPEIYVGVGSNADAEHRIAAALDALRAAFGVIRVASIVRSADVTRAGPDYLNTVACFSSDASPSEVVTRLRAIETAAGRVRPGPPQAPVPLDLDLLLYGQRVDPAARLPRRDVLTRPFVLGPLAELAPTLPHPVTGEPLASAWRRLFPANSPGCATSRRCARRPPR